MASQFFVEHQMAASIMTSHPLEAASDIDDVIGTQYGRERSLKEEMDEGYIRNKEDISKEIEEIKDRDQRWENNLLQNENGVDRCDTATNINGDNNKFSATENDSKQNVVLRRQKNRDNYAWTSTLRKVKLDCDRQSVQYTNSGDFSPVADSPDGDEQTADTGPTENMLAEPNKQRIKILINSPQRKLSVDEGTLVIEREDAPKTHLENFSKFYS